MKIIAVRTINSKYRPVLLIIGLLILSYIGTGCAMLHSKERENTPSPIETSDAPTLSPLLSLTPSSSESTPKPSLTPTILFPTPTISASENTPITFKEITGTLSEYPHYSQTLKPYAYMLTENNSGITSTVNLWRLVLETGAYSSLSSWTFTQEKVEAFSQSLQQAGYCESCEQTELAKFEEWFAPYALRLSPNSNHLALAASTFIWRDGEMLRWVWNKSVVLLDTNNDASTHVIQNFQDGTNELGQVLWAPDSNQLLLTGFTYTPDLYVYDLLSSKLIPIEYARQSEDTMVWGENNTQLLAKSQVNQGNIYTFDTANQLASTLEIPVSAKRVIGSRQGNIWIVHAENVTNYWLSKYDSESQEIDQSVQLDENAIHMRSAMGSNSGAFLAFERQIQGDWSLQIFDVEQQRSYRILSPTQPATINWEWAASTDALLIGSWDDRSKSNQVSILLMEESTLLHLPSPPDNQRITGITW